MSHAIQNPKSKIQNGDAASLTTSLKSAAHRLDFTLVGICPAVAATGVSRLAEWLDRGYAGQMHYIAARQEAYEHPRHVLNGCRSILMLGLPYGERCRKRPLWHSVEWEDAVPAAPSPKSKIQNPKSHPVGYGRISSYACGELDYHDAIHDKLKQLIAFLHTLAPTAAARGVVDTAPLLEREFAQLAGLGWTGKHTLLIQKPSPGRHALKGRGDSAALAPSPSPSPSPSSGSYFFLAALLTDLELVYDEPFTADHCGTCRACLDACPTNAFPEPYVLDATRCISYLTIELREPIPTDLRPGIGDWLFGCDVCQDVCPWNHRAAQVEEPCRERPPWRSAKSPDHFDGADAHPTANPSSVPGPPLGPQFPEAPASSDDSLTLNLEPGTLNSPIDLIALFDLDDGSFRRLFRHTPLWRARRRGILRNAAIVLGNQFRGAGVSPAILAPSPQEGEPPAEPIQARSASEGHGSERAHHSAYDLYATVRALIRGLNDPEPLIRGASAWALGQIGGAEALQAINQRLALEIDAAVLTELQLAAPSPSP